MSTGYGTWATLWIEALRGLFKQGRKGPLGADCDVFCGCGQLLMCD